MTTDEYLAAIHLALMESPIVASYVVVRQRVTSQSGHLRVRIDLINGDFLEAAEFFRLTPDGIKVADYRHQWMRGTFPCPSPSVLPSRFEYDIIPLQE